MKNFLSLILFSHFILVGQDNTPPELVDFSFLPTEIDVSENSQTFTFNYTLSDDLSGLDKIQIVFFNSNQNMFMSECALNGELYFEASDACEITVPQFQDDGLYTLLGVTVVDNIGNSVAYWTDELIEMGIQTEINIVSNPDTTPPEISAELINHPLFLPSGWSMFGFTCYNSINVEEALQPIIQDVIIVKDYTGSAYLLEWNYNGIGDFIYSYGYQIKLENTVNNFQFCPTIILTE